MVLRSGEERIRSLSSTGLLPSLVSLSRTIPLGNETFRLAVAWPPPDLQPRMSNAHRLGTHPVWALPLSLAATEGIAVAFSSSGYLDVSVPLVRSYILWIQT